MFRILILKSISTFVALGNIRMALYNYTVLVKWRDLPLLWQCAHIEMSMKKWIILWHTNKKWNYEFISLGNERRKCIVRWVIHKLCYHYTKSFISSRVYPLYVTPITEQLRTTPHKRIGLPQRCVMFVYFFFVDWVYTFHCVSFSKSSYNHPPL